MYKKIIKLYLRFAIASGFLSASADRFGWWSKDKSNWGNWDAFLEYTQLLNPLVPEGLIPLIGFIATAAEILFAVFLLIGLKTELVAKLSGILLLLFAISMALSTGIKGVFDFSVLAASAASFALGTMKEKFLELDGLLLNIQNKR